MKKRLFAVFIAAIMIFAMAIPCFAGEDLTGKLYILHSNDVHGAIDGYAKMAAYRDELEAQGADVILVDAGDFSQGDPNVSYEKGLDAVKLMNAVGYDVVTLGNHEFDFGYPQLRSNMEIREFALICSNVLSGGAPLFDGATFTVEKGGVSVGFVGIETPETQTKVNPALITEITFLTNATSPTTNEAVQQAVNGLKTGGADLVVALAHLGIDAESEPYRSTDMYAAVNGIDFVIDGHSHTVMTKGANGEPIQSTGTKFENIGVIVIDETTKTIVDNFNKPVAEITSTDEEVAALAEAVKTKVNDALGSKFAVSEVLLNGSKAPGNRTEETNNGDFITDAMIWALTEQNPGAIEVPIDNVVAITNGGGIRAAINIGDVTKKDINTVLPFGNTLAVVYVKGSELLEALEASTFCTPTAVGGFPQVAGMKFTINIAKEYDANAETYPGSTYYGPNSIQRVTIDEINGKAFDPNEQYAVITNNFCAAGGDTYYAFKAATDQFDTAIPLDEVVVDYVTEKLGGVIPASKYAEPQGRINIVEEADPEAISTVELKLPKVKAGDGYKIEDGWALPYPEVTAPEGAPYVILASSWIEPKDDDYELPKKDRTFKDGDTVYIGSVIVPLDPEKYGFAVDDEGNSIVDVKVEDGTLVYSVLEYGGNDPTSFKIEATADDAILYVVTKIQLPDKVSPPTSDETMTYVMIAAMSIVLAVSMAYVVRKNRV